MENKSELVRLEEFIDNLLAKYKQIKNTCATLEQMIEDRDAECARLMETVNELRSERSMVGEKVSGLIDRIEQWESELETNELSEKEDPPSQQGQLFQDTGTTAG